MSINWGAWVGSSPNRIRVGIEYTSVPTPPSSATTEVSISARVWAEAQNPISDSSNSFTWSGSLGSGSSPNKIVNITSGGTQLLHSFTEPVALNAASPTTVSVSATITGINSVGSTLRATVAASAVIPAKPGGSGPTVPPKTPPNVRVEFVSDTNQIVRWNSAAVTNGAVVTYYIEKYDFNVGGGAYVPQHNTTGNVLSFSSYNNAFNRKYSWRVRAVNTAGTSAWGYAEVNYTTPSPVTGQVATKLSNGNIHLGWKNNAEWAVQTEIRESRDGGTSWEPSVFVAGNLSSWVHVSPPTATHVYQLRSVIGDRKSTWRGTNSVFLAAPPFAPTLLAPNGKTISRASTATIFLWKHNSADSSEQTAAELRYKAASSGTWTVVTIAGAESLYKLVGAPWGSNTDFQWDVRTMGQNGVYGPRSATGTFYVASPPVVAFTNPLDSSLVQQSRITASWTYYSVDGDEQVKATLTLVDSALQVLWTGTLEGSGTTYTLPVAIPEGVYFQLILSAQSSARVLSNTATATFDVNYLTPPPPVLDAEWDQEKFHVGLSMRSVLGAIKTRTNLLAGYSTDRWTLAPGTYSYRETINAPGVGFVDALYVKGAISSPTLVVPDEDPYLGLNLVNEGYGETITVSTSLGEELASFSLTDGAAYSERLPFNAGTQKITIGKADGLGKGFWLWDTSVIYGPEAANYGLPTLFHATDLKDGYMYGTETTGEVWEARVIDPTEETGDIDILPTVAGRIERSMNGGATWDLVGEFNQPNGDIIDRTPTLNTVVDYRAVAISGIPSESYSMVKSVITSSIEAVFNYGSGGAQVFVVPCELEMPSSFDDHSISHLLSGRELPVNIYDLDHVASAVVPVTGNVTYTGVVEIEAVIRELTKANVFYRDYWGRSFWAKITNCSVKPYHGHPLVSLTASESDGEGGWQ